MSDTFKQGTAVTTSDTVAVQYRGIIAGTTGNIKVDFKNGGTAVVIAVVAGYLYPFTVTKIYATGTTSTGIVGLN